MRHIRGRNNVPRFRSLPSLTPLCNPQGLRDIAIVPFKSNKEREHRHLHSRTMAGKGITFLTVLILFGLTVGAVSPFVLNDRNATSNAAAAAATATAAAVGDSYNDNGDVVSSPPLLDSDVPSPHGDDLTRSTSSRGGSVSPAGGAEAATAAGGPAAGSGAAAAAAFDERYGWRAFVAIDSAQQQGGLRRLDSDSNAPGVAVYIAVFVVAVVLFLVCLRACGVGVICIPISCC